MVGRSSEYGAFEITGSIATATGGYKAGIPEQIKLGDGTELDPSHSLWHHLESDGRGGYQITAERRALHDKIVHDATHGRPTYPPGEREYHMLGGGPASGKSTILNSGMVDVPGKANAVYVNADDVKGELPEFKPMAFSRNTTEHRAAAAFAHEESSIVAARIQQVGVAQGSHIVLDGVGNSGEQKLSGKIVSIRKEGYKISAHYATVPTNTAWRRSVARAKDPAERRYVPENIVRSGHRSVSRDFPTAVQRGMFDDFVLFNTNVPQGTPPILIAIGGGSTINVVDAPAYAAFIAKGAE
jgi:predicted ABC-type ATPase